MIGWGVIYGTVFGAALFVSIPVLPFIFPAAPDVRQLLVPVLVVAAVQQPIAGVVFVLDGVLIGAGDQDYLALAGLAAAAVFAAAAVAVTAGHGGLVGLWLAFTVWLMARSPRSRCGHAASGGWSPAQCGRDPAPGNER